MCDKKPDNLSAVLYGENDLRMEQRDQPKPKDDEVLLQMESVGICVLDLKTWTSGKFGGKPMEEAVILGHEASASVVEVGQKVQHLAEGDKVAIEPGVPCSVCSYCKKGSYNLCPEISFCGVPPHDGTITRFHCHKASFCYKLPEGMDYDDGALITPLAIAVHACKKINLTIGDEVVVFGAGPIGLLCVMAAKAYGAKKVLVTELKDYRIEKAKEVGADFVVKVAACSTEDQLIKKITEQLGGKPNKCIECTGMDMNSRIALSISEPGASIAFVGFGQTDEMMLPLNKAMLREVHMAGIFRSANDYMTAIELVRSGRVVPKKLITHHYKVEDTLKAFDTLKTGVGNPIKIIIHPNQIWRP